MNEMLVVSIISSCIALASVIVTIIIFVTSRNDKMKDKSNDKSEMMEKSLLKLNMKIDQIFTTTNETRTDIKVVTNQINELDKAMAIVRRDVNTAFIRIDELRERVDEID